MQEEPRGDEPLQGLVSYEQLVNTFAEQAKAFWRSWGQPGEPMVRGVEAWAQMHRSYIQWLRQTKPTSGMPLPGLTFDPWPGPGDSEGGGWDR